MVFEDFEEVYAQGSMANATVGVGVRSDSGLSSPRARSLATRTAAATKRMPLTVAATCRPCVNASRAGSSTSAARGCGSRAATSTAPPSVSLAVAPASAGRLAGIASLALLR